LRRLAFLVLAAALVSAAPAEGALQPLTRGHGELGRSLVRAGTIKIPRGHKRGLVRVIVRLRTPPLAAAFANRRLASAGGAQLKVASSASRTYLRTLAAQQLAAKAAVGRAIPQAAIGRSFRILLDGFTVTLPARRLPRLTRVASVTRVYPSVRYTLATNESPALIGAPALEAATGARGEGMKIAVVDDGLDEHNRFFRPAGYSYPAGFPKGQRKWTTPKVIVARSFPGPGAGRRGRLPLDRRVSFHGTHVAGIAAGDAGTNAPKGPDHPAVSGLSGVAPRAYLGNYRVFNVPTPIGDVADTPQIIAAFEAAVRDGMNVINFSGGGPEVDPASDALVEAVDNVARAGVVPVISAGNDRDDFGLGSTGSPATAPYAIAVAASTNSHVFSPALRVTAPDAPASLQQIPFVSAILETPAGWARNARRLVDVTSIVGRNGKPVDTHLCGPARNPNGGQNQLPKGSLRGAIALVSRGECTFDSKAERVDAAGAVGMVLIDNRPGEGTQVPVLLELPAGTIPDLDGAHLRAYLAAHGGRTTVLIGRQPLQLQTHRGGVMAYFSSAGPTDFGHELKPDVTAPGAAILSSTLREFARSPFAVFDGTSMAAPHVSGAAALLLELHRGWTPEQVKSALVSTAGRAWDNTAETQEAPVTLEGGGLVNVVGADDPKVFTDPTSLSFGDLDVTHGAASHGLLLSISDAGGGAGTWQVDLRPQAATAGARLDVPATVTIAPGEDVAVPVIARAAATASTDGGGMNYGFLVLRRGNVVRRVPYLFVVTRPQLAAVRARPLKRVQRGTTKIGVSHVNTYRFPSAPFGMGPEYTSGPAMNEGGAEHLYVTHVTRPVANVGVAITSFSPATALVHPWFLGSQDENDVQGYVGTPVNVNGEMLDYGIDLGAAGAEFPRQGTYYVSVDSGADPFTQKQQRGRYVLRSWVNDVTPPRLRLLTSRVAEGRPLVVARVVDTQSGVDPYSIELGYQQVLLSPAAYDPDSGLAVFALPYEAPALHRGPNRVLLIGSDNQETKNANTDQVLPNTGYRSTAIKRVARPVLSWLAPRSGKCLRGRVSLLVLASSPRAIRLVRFFDGSRRFRTVRRGASGLFTTGWRPGRRGRHVLYAIARDAAGRTATARRNFRVCK
jgi:minor extracellular serine protease Vpr